MSPLYPSRSEGVCSDSFKWGISSLPVFSPTFLTYKQQVCCNWPFSQGGFSESAFFDQHIPIFKYFQAAAVKKVRTLTAWGELHVLIFTQTHCSQQIPEHDTSIPLFGTSAPAPFIPRKCFPDSTTWNKMFVTRTDCGLVDMK